MSNHKDHITNLTPELMQQYVDGSLSSDMQYQVERYLLDHPFEAEAVEGMESIQSTDFINDVDSLKKRLISVKDNNVVIPLWKQYWKVAAVITVLVVSTFLILEMNRSSDLTNNELALNDEEIPEATEEEKAVEPIVELVPEEKDVEVQLDETNQEEEVFQTAEKSIALEVIEEKPQVTPAAPEEIMLDDQFMAESTEEVMADDLIAVETDVNEESLAIASEEQAEGKQAKSAAAVSSSFKLADASLSPETPIRTVSGKVTSQEDGVALFGINVIITGTTTGTMTDIDGNYQLSISSDQESLSYSFIGYENKEVEIGSRSVIDLAMSEDVSQLSEVVVTGVGVDRTSKSLGFATAKKKNSKRKESAQPLQGLTSYLDYLKSSIKYPQDGLDNNISGTVVVEFVVNKDGKLTSFEIVKSLGYGCDEEAIRLIKEGPEWQPATKRGKAISETVNVEVSFD